MKPNDRARLTAALRDHVAQIATDLRAKIRVPGLARDRAKQLHTDERVAEDFDVWTDLLSRRAAVLWVLKSVYVRVLEDRGLLAPGRLLDPEAQQLFERLAPHLGETAFLRWIYRDLSSPHGGLPELFSLQPAEVVLPSDELSRALIGFWRYRDADTGAVWSFAEEHFEGELMGDLYQELDPVVKERFALCQTPDFVRAFILDRTLTPAIETFGADEVRLLDPACGSGHFLIDGLKRLVTATAAKHPDWSRPDVVGHALNRVVGIDLNDYACALARTRLVMTAAELTGVTKLADAARFHPHVYWADGLEQIERRQQQPSFQHSLFERDEEEKPRAVLTRSDVRAVLEKVISTRFHAVVANPPYVTESDNARRSYHKEHVSGRQRYLSAYKEYHLSCPFVERAFQLSRPAGFVGLFVDNQFLRKDFGKPLIESVLAHQALSLLVDTSFAHIPFHGTPTILIFARNQVPQSSSVRIVAGKKGENETPADPTAGRVWKSIQVAWQMSGFDDDYVSSFDLSSEELAKHPWALAGTDSARLKSKLDAAGIRRLKDITEDSGAGVLTRADEVYLMPKGLLSARFPASELRSFATGKGIRDWGFLADMDILYPYTSGSETLISSAEMERWLWRFRTRLWLRREPNGNHREIGLQWWEWSRFIRRRSEPRMRLALSNVAAHNHFVLVSGTELLGSHAPCLRLREDATEQDYLSLLAILNSSVFCFWMKQVFQPKGKTSANRNHPSPERFTYEIGTTQLQQFPLPDISVPDTMRIAGFSRQLVECAQKRSRALSEESWLASTRTSQALRSALAARWQAHDASKREMVFLQEEVDWYVYFLFGLCSERLTTPSGQTRLARGQRAFEFLRGHRSFVRKKNVTLSPEVAECDLQPEPLLMEYEQVLVRRIREIESNPSVSHLENYMFKRLWRDTEENVTEHEFRRRHDAHQLRLFLEARLEQVAKSFSTPFTISKLAAPLMSDEQFHAVAEVYSGTQSYSLEALVSDLVGGASVPSHPSHVYTASGLVKFEAWEDVWRQQFLEEASSSEDGTPIPPPPEYSQGSRGKAHDFRRSDYWNLRGKMDAPSERYFALTEAPVTEPVFGWAGWSPQQRLRAILALDEGLEDQGTPLSSRIGLLDSAWRLLPYVAREDTLAAARLKAELQSLLGPEGPSKKLIENWNKDFPPPGTRTRKEAVKRLSEDDGDNIEESDQL